MIATKAIPSFYVIDLEGDAANLDFLLGGNHQFNIRRVCIGSFDFNTDIEAAVAGKAALDLVKNNLDLDGIEEITAFNPEFFVGQQAIEPTLQMLIDEEIAEEKVEDAENGGGHVAIFLTRRFDDWGDYVVSKTTLDDPALTITLKIAANPQRYMLEKNLEKQEHLARLHGFHLPVTEARIH
jgi:hypothetical protein